MQPKNFSVNDRVVISNTTSPQLDGQKGTVLGTGISLDAFGSAYIVLLDEPTATHRAILLTEACLSLEEKFNSDIDFIVYSRAPMELFVTTPEKEAAFCEKYRRRLDLNGFERKEYGGKEFKALKLFIS